MNHTWEEFKEAYNNEQEARFGFCDLCDQIMTLQYPEYSIVRSQDILENDIEADPEDKGKKQILYLPKFFLDHVSNSRKGQIRKSFNENLPYMNNNGVKEWVLFLPKALSDEEKSWWQNWTTRVIQENKVTPVLYDSQAIFALLRKFKITGEYFKEEQDSNQTQIMDFYVEEVKQEIKEEVKEEVKQEVKEEVKEDVSQVKEEVKQEIVEQIKEEIKQAASNNITEDSSKSQEGKEENSQEESNEKPLFGNFLSSMGHLFVDEKEEVFDNQITKDFYKRFHDLDEKQKELTEEQFKIFTERRQASSVTNYIYDYRIDNIADISIEDLLYKARVICSNEQFERALYIYQYIADKNICPKDNEQELLDGIRECNDRLEYKYNMILGDFLFSTRDFINASEKFGKACKLVNVNYEAVTKMNESYGEALMDVGEFKGAWNKFEEALNTDSANQQIIERRDLAKYLEKGAHYFDSPWLSWLNVFIAPFYYLKARNLDTQNKDLKTKGEKLRKKALGGFILILCILALLILIPLLCKFVWNKVKVDEVETVSSLTPFDIQMRKGQYYRDNVTFEKIHYIDSAINCFKRAQRYMNTDTTAEIKYNEAIVYKEKYKQKVQNDISNDSATYFLSMRKPTEGLRLFKYMYDSNDNTKGKFGYCDTLGNVVIVPIYDFNYKTMDQTGETFKDGKAKVCLIVAPGDTTYFYIDKFGNPIE